MPKKANKVQNDSLTPGEVADLLKVSPVTVRHWALEGRLKFVTTPGGHRRFARADIEKLAAECGVSLNPPEPQGLRILVVDDNRSLAEYLREMLSNLDSSIAVMLAHDGFEAGEKLHLFKPDLVLLDLKMPGPDGFEICRRIKQNEVTQHIRVVAMSGFPSEENVRKITTAGADLCLGKPIVVPDLLQALGVSLEPLTKRNWLEGIKV